jgi:hypothetical protein
MDQGIFQLTDVNGGTRARNRDSNRQMIVDDGHDASGQIRQCEVPVARCIRRWFARRCLSDPQGQTVDRIVSAEARNYAAKHRRAGR